MNQKKYNRRYYLRHTEKEKARTRQFRETHPDWYRAYYAQPKVKRAIFIRWLKDEYAISIEKFDEMLLDQCGRCAICNQPMKDVDVDHDHSTQEVRGLLCRSCNTFIGLAKESEDVLLAAIEYLRQHK